MMISDKMISDSDDAKIIMIVIYHDDLQHLKWYAMTETKK